MQSFASIAPSEKKPRPRIIGGPSLPKVTKSYYKNLMPSKVLSQKQNNDQNYIKQNK